MAENNENNTSLIPIGSTGLVRVGNSIEVTNKILSEFKNRELGRIHFKGNLLCEIKEIGGIRTIFHNGSEFQISTDAESSIAKFDTLKKVVKDRIKFNGHFEFVAFDNNRNSVAIASGKTIYITSNDSGQIMQKLEGHTREINILIFSRDGKQLLSGSSDKTIRIWDTENWHCAGILEGHKWLVNSLKLTSDDKYLYSGGWDAFIIKWDMQTFKEVDRFDSGNNGGIKCLELTKDDKQIISGGGDKVVRIFNSLNFKIIAEISGHTDFVSCLNVSNDNKLLASGGWDGQIFIYALGVNEIIQNFQAFSKEAGIHTLSFSIDGKYLLAGSSGRNNFNLKCWE